MIGKSPLWATKEQQAALAELAGSRDRGDADRARAIVLTISGWTSGRIAKAFGVREDTVRLWRSDFMRGGVDALKATVAPGPAPVKSAAALRVAIPLLSERSRVPLWKHDLQGFADETGLAIMVAHHPPGTSKWNRIEHRLFAFITQNWR